MPVLPGRGAPLTSPAVVVPRQASHWGWLSSVNRPRCRPGQQQPGGHQKPTAPPDGCPTAVRLCPPHPPGAELCTQRHLGQRGTNKPLTPPPRVLLEAPSGFTARCSKHPGPLAATPAAALPTLHGAGLHPKNTKAKPSVVQYLRQNTSSRPTAATSPPVSGACREGAEPGHTAVICANASSEAGLAAPAPSSPSGPRAEEPSSPGARTHLEAELGGPHAS